MHPILLSLLLVPRPVLSGVEATVHSKDGAFLVHYTLAGADALANGATDADNNGIPDDADRVLDGLEELRGRWIEGSQRRYMMAPLADTGVGGDASVDVYMHLLDGRGLTTPDTPAVGAVGASPSARSAFIEIDPRVAKGSALHRAALHEGMHAVQCAYSTALPAWIAEATAAYAEIPWLDADQDEVDARFHRLLEGPGVPLDRVDGVHEYDVLLLLQYLAVTPERLPMDVIALLWERMAATHDVIASIESVAGEGMTPVPVQVVLERFAAWLSASCAPPALGRMLWLGPFCNTALSPLRRGIVAAPSSLEMALPPLSYAWLALADNLVEPDCMPMRGRERVALQMSGGEDLAFGLGKMREGAAFRGEATIALDLFEKEVRIARGRGGGGSISIDVKETRSPIPCGPQSPPGADTCAMGGRAPASSGGAPLLLIALSLACWRAWRRGVRRGGRAPS